MPDFVTWCSPRVAAVCSLLLMSSFCAVGVSCAAEEFAISLLALSCLLHPQWLNPCPVLGCVTLGSPWLTHRSPFPCAVCSLAKKELLVTTFSFCHVLSMVPAHAMREVNRGQGLKNLLLQLKPHLGIPHSVLPFHVKEPSFRVRLLHWPR